MELATSSLEVLNLYARFNTNHAEVAVRKASLPPKGGAYYDKCWNRYKVKGGASWKPTSESVGNHSNNDENIACHNDLEQNSDVQSHANPEEDVMHDKFADMFSSDDE